MYGFAPEGWIHELNRLFPNLWTDLRKALEKPKRFMNDDCVKFIGDVPSWCPMSTFFPYLTLARRLGPDVYLRYRDAVMTVASMYLWRAGKGIYRFSPELFRALVNQPFSGDIPNECLYRMPEWAVYIETPGIAIGGLPVSGFIAHLDYKGCIYRRVGDIALVLYILFDHEKGRYISGRIPREAFEKWGISENAAIDAALENTERIHPATLAKLVRRPVRKAMATAYKPMGLLRDLTESIEDTRLVSLSGRDNPNGAVSLFYPGVMELLFEKISGPYYASFIGLDGVVIHSVSQIDARTALESLKDTNTRYNRPEDILSTHIYRYDGNSFEIVRI